MIYLKNISTHCVEINLSPKVSWKDIFPKIFFQRLGTLHEYKATNFRVFFCTFLAKYLKRTLKIHLEKLRKNGGFALLNKSLEP